MLQQQNGAKPKALLLLSGNLAHIEERINALTDEYALMNGISFLVVKDEVVASACLVNKAELRKAAIAQPGMHR